MGAIFVFIIGAFSIVPINLSLFPDINYFVSNFLKYTGDLFQDQCYSMALGYQVPENLIPDIDKLNFVYMTPCCNYIVPLSKADDLWKYQKFQQNRKLVILAPGWLNTIDKSNSISTISKAFMCRPDVNFLAIDSHSYVDTLFTWAAINANLIGQHIAVGLQKLVEPMPSIEIHLIGHSLGAHIMGSAGREYHRLTNRLVSRITGLDPAKPCFIHRMRMILENLDRGDALLVDIIHSNPGVLGQRSAVGDVDFYPGGTDCIKPGCINLDCSHSRAIEYFAESVYPQQESNFLSHKCESYEALENKTCTLSTSTMGYVIDKNANGIYYLDVNSQSPFGQNAKTTTTVDLSKGSDKCKCKDVPCK